MKFNLVHPLTIEIARADCGELGDHWYYIKPSGEESDCYDYLSDAQEAAVDEFKQYLSGF